jgi:hypothetical protein
VSCLICSLTKMFPHSLFFPFPLALLGPSHAAPASDPVTALAGQLCYANENTSLLCYEFPKGMPQNVTVEDVAYVASYLRSYGAQTRTGRLYNMAAADAPDCAEWSIYAHGTGRRSPHTTHRGARHGGTCVLTGRRQVPEYDMSHSFVSPSTMTAVPVPLLRSPRSMAAHPDAVQPSILPA